MLRHDTRLWQITVVKRHGTTERCKSDAAYSKAKFFGPSASITQNHDTTEAWHVSCNVLHWAADRDGNRLA